jgi:hypothetical protein
MPNPPADDVSAATTTNAQRTPATPGSGAVGFKSPSAYSRFARRVVGSHRYVLDADSHDFLSTLHEQARERQQVIPGGAIFWRAQLGHGWEPIWAGEEHIDDAPGPFPAARMAPLKGRAREGRGNPKGIPYLYLANRKETAMSEVRPWLGSYVSLAQFKVMRDLTIVNCVTEEKARHSSFRGVPPEDWDQSVWWDIDKAFSQPISQSDDQAEYAPTQVIAEFFKTSGLDGVGYRSAFGKGYNIVLFDMAVADLINCVLYEVKDMTFDFHQCSNAYFVAKHYADLEKTKKARAKGTRRKEN